MKFLLDVGITPALGRLLEADGHSFRYLPDFYSNKTTDANILDIARQHSHPRFGFWHLARLFWPTTPFRHFISPAPYQRGGLLPTHHGTLGND